MKIDSVTNIITQILIWGVGWLFILLILTNGGEFDVNFWRRAILMVAGASMVVFFNLKWLLPNLYFQKKKVRYFLSTTAILLIVVWGMHSDHLPWNQEERPEIERFKDQNPEKVFEKTYIPKFDSNFRWLIRNIPSLFISLLGSSSGLD
jgi:hypothetical protein